MKNISILFIVVIPLLLMSCGTKEIERLSMENDSLRNITQYDELQIDEYLMAFNEIQENMNFIKEKENIISFNTSPDTEMSGNIKDRINDDMTTIYDLMKENKQTIQALKKKLKSSGANNSRLEKTIALLNSQIVEKDKEMSALKEELAQLNIKIDGLNTEITDLNSDIDTLETLVDEQGNKIDEQGNIIDEQDQLLNTAYYASGTKKELTANGVLSKNGIFKKIELDDDFDKTYFTKIDIRELSEINISAKKVDLMTSHSSSSYQIVEENGKVIAFKITDAEKFWETSKFLVIVLK